MKIDLEFSSEKSKNGFTSKFDLNEGLVMLTTKQENHTSFYMQFFKENATNEDWRIEDGFETVSKIFQILRAGLCQCRVLSDMSWRLRIQQPISPETASSNLSLQGKESMSSDFIKLREGNAILNIQHNGLSFFCVSLFNVYGKKHPFFLKEIGNVKTKKEITIESDGIYLFDVDADGEWKIEINQ